MSNPNRTLGNRVLPPLSRNHSSRTNYSFSKKDLLSESEKLTESRVSEYLSSNPDFLDSFILQHFQAERLQSLLCKVEMERKLPSGQYSCKKILMQELPRLCNKLDENEKANKEDDEFKRRKETLIQMVDEFRKVVKIDMYRLYLLDVARNVMVETHSNEQYQMTEKKYLCIYVALQRNGFITSDILTDKRFNQYVSLNNSIVRSVMVCPIIIQRNDQLLGVLEVYRNADKQPFNDQEEAIMNSYIMWTSFSIFYAEIFILNRKQEKLNDFILNVTQKMFGHFADMDKVIKEIMESAKCLVNAERVTLFLLHKETNQLSARIFDVGSYGKCKFETREKNITVNVGEGIAGYVAETGSTLNVRDAYSHSRFNRKIDGLTGYVTQTILAMPVKVDDVLIGVVQMLNKKDAQFTADDENEFKTFATYCGLALHIGKMYGKLLRSQQKNKVSMDVLSYHSCTTADEYNFFHLKKIPKKIESIIDIMFWPWTVSFDNTIIHLIYMFETLFDTELFERGVILKFVLTVRKNYRSVPYHNWAHAFSVAHSVYALLMEKMHQFTLVETISMFVGSLCHDLDHRGKTNQYMIDSASALSNLYSTSTMEHHHFNMTIFILQRSGHNIFQNFTSSDYHDILSLIKHCILATDLARFFEAKTKFQPISEDATEYKFHVDWNNPDCRMNYMGLCMTFADLSSMFKNWEMQLTLVFTIMEEFWVQGDEERKRGTKPVLMMDRTQKLELPKLQVGFLDIVCLPCFRLIAHIIPNQSSLKRVVISATKNRDHWASLSELREDKRAKVIHEMEESVDKFKTRHDLTLS